MVLDNLIFIIILWLIICIKILIDGDIMNLLDNITQQNFILKNIVSKALELTCAYSVESAVSVIKTQGIAISTRYGEIENVVFDTNEILSVTVFFKQKKGTAFSNNLDNNAIISTVDSAVNIARYSSEDLYSGIADKELLEFHPVYLDLCHPIALDIKLGISLAATAEQIALKYDPRIVCTDGGKFNSHVVTRVFGNSHGMLNSYSSTQHSLFCSVIAESSGSMEQNYAYTLSRVFEDLRSPEWVGYECANRVLKQLGSKKIKTTESSVLFMSDIAISLFKHLADAIHGSNVYKGSTFLLNDLEKIIFPSWISIREYPHLLKGIGSAPFDNEGVQTLDRIIVQDGILKHWLLDTYSARKMGLKSTGHSGGIYNWYIDNKNISVVDLIKDMHCGLVVTSLMGQGVNIITGDYSRGVSGFWVENGEIQYPVSEITVSGNLKQMFRNIVSISNDIETRDTIYCGSVLIDSMKIAGI